MASIVVFAGTSKLDVWAIIDRDKDRIADDVVRFASGFEFKTPSGLCFSTDGFLYVIEPNRVLLFPAAEVTFDYPDYQSIPVVEIVPAGKLVSVEEAFSNQTARACSVGTDNKLYILLGKDHKRGAASIIRMDRDGRNFEAHSHRTDVSRPGTLFYTGTMFPDKYRGGVFSAHPSSANGTDSVDDLLVFMPGGNTGSAEPFVIGRPTSGPRGGSAGLAQLHDGSILMSDGLTGAVYRISYWE